MAASFATSGSCLRSRSSDSALNHTMKIGSKYEIEAQRDPEAQEKERTIKAAEVMITE
jgi:hypothetical protein